METNLTANGYKIKDVDMVRKYGLMVISTKEIGKKILEMERVNLFGPMAIAILDNGKIIKKMDKVLI
jgi:hypothetical protein